MERPDLYQREPDGPYVRDLADDQPTSDAAALKLEIDVERLVWDPDYRAWVKENMRRTA